MKKINVTLIFILFFSLIQAQNQLVKQWDYRFGGDRWDELLSFKQTNDGGYILGGSAFSDSTGDISQRNRDSALNTGDYWIIKIDSIGNKKWDKRFGGNNYEQLWSIQQTNDGGYIMGGISFSDSSGDISQPSRDTALIATLRGDYWIVKIDSSGNKQWDKRFGGQGVDALLSLEQTSDYGYILAGYSKSDSSGDRSQPSRGSFDYWIIKTDSLGNKLWDKRFGGTEGDICEFIKQTVDGGYILGGYSWSGNNGDKSQGSRGGADYWILKTDSHGNKEWDKRFGGNDEDYLYSLQQTSDGGYILGGCSSSDSGGDKTAPMLDTTTTSLKADYWILKTDSIGNKQWDKKFGGFNRENYFGNISQNPDGGYLLAGASNSGISGDKTETNLGSNQTWIIRTNPNGIKIWDKTIFTGTYDQKGFAILTTNNCYLVGNYTTAGIGGYKTQSSRGGNDYWIVKFGDTTVTTSINQIYDTQLSISIYPNPTDAILNLSLNNKTSIAITTVLGEIVLQEMRKGNIVLDVSFLPAGIYFIKVGNEVRKFVKE